MIVSVCLQTLDMLTLRSARNGELTQVRIYLSLLIACTFAWSSPLRVLAVDKEKRGSAKGSLSIRAQAVQVAGLPVFFTVNLKNTGDAPISYWCGRGSDGYPQGELFEFQILDATKKIVKAEAFNGAYTQGSGIDKTIAPNSSVEFPLTASPLPSGTYEVRLTSAKITFERNGETVTQWPKMQTENAIKVAVKADEKLKNITEANLFDRVRSGEFFATRVVNHYAIPAVTARLLPLLESDSVKEAFNVAHALSMSKDIPVNTGRHIDSAMRKCLSRTPSSYENTNLMVYLCEIAKRCKDDLSLEAVSKLAKDGPSVESRWRAVQAIALFEQPSVVSVLHVFLKSDDTAVKGAAAVGLAEKNDASAIPVLIEVAKTRDGHQSWNSIYKALARFPKDARARAAILEGLKSDDESLKRDAQDAAKMLPQ